MANSDNRLNPQPNNGHTVDPDHTAGYDGVAVNAGRTHFEAKNTAHMSAFCSFA